MFKVENAAFSEKYYLILNLMAIMTTDGPSPYYKVISMTKSFLLLMQGYLRA